MEPLEDRRMLATIVVDSLADNTLDDGLITLREAVLAANNDAVADPTEGTQAGNGAEVIQFDPALTSSGPATIFLEQGELPISESVTIQGPSADLLTIDASLQSRLFNVNDGQIAVTQVVEISGVTLMGGSVFAAGGAITNNENLTITRSTITGNAAGTGGAIFSMGGSLTITGSTISGNLGELGGGVSNYSSTLTIIGSTISGNASVTGGGVYHYGGKLTVNDSTISGNSADVDGGGIYILSAPANPTTITSSTISGNWARDDGGGIAVANTAELVLQNSTVTANTSNFDSVGGGEGGGISFISQSTLTLNHTIVAGNTSNAGVATDIAAVGPVTATFSLIGNNVGTSLAPAPTPDAAGNLIGSSAGSGVIDPLLSPLANHGGPTFTHALLAGSPALDAGHPLIPTNPNIFDQRGAPFVRVFDGDGTGGARIDMGAFERQTVAGLSLIVDTNADVNDGDYSAGNLSLREATGLANGSVGPDTIEFRSALDGQSIDLISGAIEITEAVSIGASAPGDTLIIDAQQQSRIFDITAMSGDIALSNLVLTRGFIDGEGGAIRSITSGSLELRHSIVSDSTAFGRGGGVSATGALTITQSTISGNRSAVGSGLPDTRGGGLFAGGNLSVSHSTVTANTAAGGSGQGGGIYVQGGLSLANTIVAGNSAVVGPDLQPGVGTLSIDYSLIGNTSGTGINAGTGIGNILNQNPRLGPLANNGGPAKTHALLGGSPAIDAGDPSVPFNPGEFDQRGAPFVRVFDGDGGGARVDMGAYERQTVPVLILLVDTLADENDGDYSAGDLSLREAIGLANGSIGSDEIEFAPTLTGSGPATIVLSQGELLVSDATTIVGPGANLLSVDASGNDTEPDLDDGTGTRVLNIDDGLASLSTVEMIGLTLTGGDVLGDGGGIRSSEHLTITSSIVTGNSAHGLGGGISTDGNVALVGSTVSDNSSHVEVGNLHGGGVYASGSVTLADSTVTGNTAHTDNGNSSGGGIYAGGNVTLTDSTVSANSVSSDVATSRGGGIYTLGAIALSGSTVSGNSILGTDAVGGGVFAGGFANVFNSTVSYNNVNTHRNNGDARGGGLVAIGSTTLAGSNVIGNQALGYSVNGGGLATDGPLTITSSTVSNNTAQGNTAAGGGMEANGTVTIAGSTVVGNSANSIAAGGSARGGGIEADDSVTISESIVTGNTANAIEGGARGGGVFVDGTVTLVGSIVSGNSAYTNGGYAGGGGVRSTDSILLSGSTVSGNSAVGFSNARGGGVLAGGDATLNESTVSNNETEASGGNSRGGGVFVDGNATIFNTTVSGNTLRADAGSARGGGVFADGDLTLTSGTISSNEVTGTTGRGGGAHAGGTVSITHSTVADNSATDLGGGVHAGEPITIMHSIVARNTAAGNPDLRSIDGSFTVQFSLIGDAEGTSLLEAQTPDSNGNLIGTTDLDGSVIDPLLGPLADNGGPTATHALLPGSPAIDAGDPSFVPPPLTDQRGFVRVANGRIDMGALESGAPPLPSFNFVVDIAVDEFDWDFGNGDLSLREAIVLSNIDAEVRTITFQPGLSGATIRLELSLGELNISDSATIDGSSLPGGISIDAGRGDDGNSGTGDGIRVFLVDDNLGGTNVDVEFIDLNITGGDISGDGGAIRSRENLTISGSTISGNSGYMGGGVFNSVGNLTITGSTVSGNSAYGGGGIVNSSGNATITESTISGNSATAYAGGIDNASGTMTISRSTVSGNTANLGAGVRNYYGTMMVTDSTISGNTAGDVGGGAYNTSGTLTITSSTITNNTAGTLGGGVYTDVPVGTHTVVGSSIVAGNMGGDVGRSENIPNNTFQSMGFNLIGGGNAVDAFTNDDQTGIANPLLGSLSDNGGPTLTHAVLQGSPAIDAGDPDIAFHPSEFDQRGAPFLRVRDGQLPIGARIDVGAFELQDPPPPDLVGDYNRDGRVNSADFTVYRDTLGDVVTPFTGADGNGDGVISESDYAIWKSQFGKLLVMAASVDTGATQSLDASHYVSPGGTTRSTSLVLSENRVDDVEIVEMETTIAAATSPVLAVGSVTTSFSTGPVRRSNRLARLSTAALDSLFADRLQLQLALTRLPSATAGDFSSMASATYVEEVGTPVDDFFAEIGTEVSRDRWLDF